MHNTCVYMITTWPPMGAYCSSRGGVVKIHCVTVCRILKFCQYEAGAVFRIGVEWIPLPGAPILTSIS